MEERSACPDFDQSLGDKAAYSQWEWVPPGRECVYDENYQQHVDGPPDARLALVAMLIVWPLATITAARLATLDRAETQLAEPHSN